MQKTIDLQDGGALILSVAKYYSPSGKAIQDAAVTPNVLVADASDDSAISDDDGEEPANTEQPEAKPKNTPDDQLQKAVEVLKSRASSFGITSTLIAHRKVRDFYAVNKTFAAKMAKDSQSTPGKSGPKGLVSAPIFIAASPERIVKILIFAGNYLIGWTPCYSEPISP